MKQIPLVAAAMLMTLGAAKPATADLGYYWQNAARHSFCSNFQAGREADGRALYVSQTSRPGFRFGVNITMTDNNTSSSPILASERGEWHLGKAGVHLADGMTYSFGGGEVDVGRFHIPQGNKYGHLVLCLTENYTDRPQRLQWVSGANGSHHPSAVRGFNTEEGQLVCRASWAGGVHPGKLIPSSGACFFGYGGGEKGVQSYEVLVYD
jgi:hypothetical protein